METLHPDEEVMLNRAAHIAAFMEAYVRQMPWSRVDEVWPKAVAAAKKRYPLADQFPETEVN